MTPSPMLCRVICALSFSRNSASSYSLRSVMSSSTPTRRSSRPLSSTLALARLITQRHSPVACRSVTVQALEQRRLACNMIPNGAACTRDMSSECTRGCAVRGLADIGFVIPWQHRLPARRQIYAIVGMVSKSHNRRRSAGGLYCARAFVAASSKSRGDGAGFQCVLRPVARLRCRPASVKRMQLAPSQFSRGCQRPRFRAAPPAALR